LPLPMPLPSITISTRKRQRVASLPAEQPLDDRDQSPALSTSIPPVQYEVNGVSISADISKHSHESISAGRRQPLPAILVAASHNEGLESSRKTSRQLMAFGVKLPAIENMEFELPYWLDLPFDDDFATDGPFVEDGASIVVHNESW